MNPVYCVSTLSQSLQKKIPLRKLTFYYTMMNIYTPQKTWKSSKRQNNKILHDLVILDITLSSFNAYLVHEILLYA